MPGFLIYIWYFFRSVFYRGLTNTLRLPLYEAKYEKFFGINTLAVKTSTDSENYHYQGASYGVLSAIFKQMPEDIKNAPFIDFGSGKGRPLIVAEYYGFNHLIGVELDKDLITCAENNIKKYPQKRTVSRFSFLHKNANEYKIPDDALSFFFFNPFGESTIGKVADAIIESAEKNKKTIYVIYVNPKFRTVFYEKGFYDFYIYKTGRYLEAVILKYNPNSSKNK